MRDPFTIDRPTCISFSGGRTSAYMLWRVLDANGGLTAQTVVCFANTGKEVEATLRFVRDCASHWRVPIHWLEYRAAEPGFAVVDFDTASRAGEPFEALIRRRQYLPNPVARGCTTSLKIRPMHRFVRGLGWTEWDQFIGIRADEHRRVAKIRARGHSTESVHETMCMPLADSGATVRHVTAFWQAQPFDLELLTVNGRTLEGNCDLCFLKPRGQRLALIKAQPEAAVWWIAEPGEQAQRRPVSRRWPQLRRLGALRVRPGRPVRWRRGTDRLLLRRLRNRMTLELMPVSLRGANAYVQAHHRHHRPVQGGKFSLAVTQGDDNGSGRHIVGVVIVARPVARHLDDGWTLEVTRLCTDGTANACSKLYAAAFRAARALGYIRLITYTLPAEGGASLRAAGWHLVGQRGGGNWNRARRPRRDTPEPLRTPKHLWEAR